MKTEQAPDSCPFCGCADGIERKIYRETTIERLTRERDLAMAALERLDARVKRLEEAGDALERDKQAFKKVLADLGVVGSMGFGSTVKWAQAKEAKP